MKMKSSAKGKYVKYIQRCKVQFDFSCFVNLGGLSGFLVKEFVKVDQEELENIVIVYKEFLECSFNQRFLIQDLIILICCIFI